MIQQVLNDLEEYVLKYNAYFTDSYADVSNSPFTGYLMSGENVIFPNDTLGNYFYIRIPNFTKFNYSELFRISEGINPIGVEIQCTLVACVRSANPETLLENLITTIQHYQPDYVKFQNCTTQRDIICAVELSKIPKDEIKNAIGKLDKDYTIVSISFILMAPYTIQKLSCIKSPIV